MMSRCLAWTLRKSRLCPLTEYLTTFVSIY